MKTPLKILLFCSTSLLFISCDRVTKDLAKQHLMNRPPISYFHNTIRLSYIENTGAAMSMGDGLSKNTGFVLLCLLPLLFLLFISAYVIRKMREISIMKMISFSLLIAGGLGNVMERVFFDRHVTDFMNIGINNIRTGIFNVADVCVSLGAIGLVIFYKDNSESNIAT